MNTSEGAGRRSFFKRSALATAALFGIKSAFSSPVQTAGDWPTLALNAFSFNRLLSEGGMNLEELFRFARVTGFHALDLTAYYIPGYPEVPADSDLFEIRKKAFRAGLDLSGTGVRNDFTVEDRGELKKQVRLVKNWIEAASMLGIPHVRVFDGKGAGRWAERQVIRDQVVDSFRECAAFGADRGVMVAFQNHYDFIKSVDEVIAVLEAVDSPWFGLMLDIGSVPGPDPYDGIDRLVPYAISWQVKENVRTGDGKVPTNFHALMSIVHSHGYTGYFPLETLGEGDPRAKVRALYRKVVQQMA